MRKTAIKYANFQFFNFNFRLFNESCRNCLYWLGVQEDVNRKTIEYGKEETMGIVRRNNEIKPFYSNFWWLFEYRIVCFWRQKRSAGIECQRRWKGVGVGIESSGDEKEDIHLDYRDGILTISGEKNEEKKRKIKINIWGGVYFLFFPSEFRTTWREIWCCKGTGCL